MSKKRGLSIDEKRQRMLQLFHEKKEFLLLKEVERMAFKEKGIVSQSVKEVLQSLVDDDMVNSDKIGSSVYFWSFPSNSLVMKKKKLNELKVKLNKDSHRIKELCTAISELSRDRKDSPDRKRMLERYERDFFILDFLKSNLSLNIQSIIFIFLINYVNFLFKVKRIEREERETRI